MEPTGETIASHWAFDPIGLRYSLNDFYLIYKLPLFVTENGLGTKDVVNEDGTINDDYRKDI